MFDNILRFTCLFLSGDLDLIQESPEYFIEKFEYFIGENIEVKSHELCFLYKKKIEVWGIQNYLVNSILLFLYDIYSKSSNVKRKLILNTDGMHTSAPRNIRCEPDEYIKSFNKWIGNVEDIDKTPKKGLHFIIERDMINVYYNTYETEIKKIELNEKLKKLKNTSEIG